MYALMIAFMSLAIVGAVATVRHTANPAEITLTEDTMAVNFYRYSNAVKCYARAQPTFSGAAPTVAAMKSTSLNGAPCLHPSYKGIVEDISTGPMKAGEFRALVTGTQVITYASPMSIRGTPAPINTMYRYGGYRYAIVGALAADRKSIVSPGGGVVGTLPDMLGGTTTQNQNGLVVGAPVQIVPRN